MSIPSFGPPDSVINLSAHFVETMRRYITAALTMRRSAHHRLTRALAVAGALHALEYALYIYSLAA